jgi:hypothetical protein
MGIGDDKVATAAGYGEGNGTSNVHCMLRGASNDLERRLTRLEALADRSIEQGLNLNAIVAELQAAGDDAKSIMMAAGYAATGKPEECVAAMVRGACKDAAAKYWRLEERAATYSVERFAAIVRRLRQAEWTDDDIVDASGYGGFDGCSVDTLLQAHPHDVQSRYTKLRQMMHRVIQISRMHPFPCE